MSFEFFKNYLITAVNLCLYRWGRPLGQQSMFVSLQLLFFLYLPLILYIRNLAQLF
ncbi:hypothetical protein Mgra_00009830 [Meloidogyne graminicola]|uniref:Uncharacterized protein n=1 Tax=Meloidogyne graminicola TaxID=189291 RepID=A0A8S9ZBQ6_9BILA|nr:hypothetical protein Mgra_00009830 [Meloidogyne graminicola]